MNRGRHDWLAARPHLDRRVRSALMALVFVILAGTCGYMWVESWSFQRSLFFTLITLTTVGYGDYGLSPAGERFTILVLLAGAGIFTYSVSVIAPPLLDQRRARERRMNRMIDKLSDHFIVCGLGRIGLSVCRRLAREGVPFVAVDPRPDAVEPVAEAGFAAIVGDATDDEVLERAGVRRARGIACVAESDSINIVIALGAHELNPDLYIVSRAEHPDAVRKMRRAGALRVISPIQSGGISIANAILKPHLAEFLELAHDRSEDFELAEITVDDDSPLNGHSLDEYDSSGDPIVFVALKHQGGPMRLRPPGGEMLRPGDILIVAGQGEALARLQQTGSPPPLAA